MCQRSIFNIVGFNPYVTNNKSKICKFTSNKLRGLNKITGCRLQALRRICETKPCTYFIIPPDKG